MKFDFFKSHESDTEKVGNGMSILEGKYHGERILVGSIGNEEVRIEEHIFEEPDYSYTYTYSGKKNGVQLSPDQAKELFTQYIEEAEDKREFIKKKTV